MYTKLMQWLAKRLEPAPLGARGELAAARFLRRLGYRIVARNQREWRGELDLVAVDRRTVVFVEVKSRRSADTEHPAEAVTLAKQRRVSRAALSFMKRHHLLSYPARFDVVAVIWPTDQRLPQIEHFIAAFEWIGEKGDFE